MKLFAQNIIYFILLISFFGNALEKYPPFYTSQDSIYLNRVINKNQSTPSNSQALKNMGIAYHQLAFIEQENASKQAVEYLKQYIELIPDDFLVLAYLGSSYTMLARDTNNKLKQLYYVNKSLGLLDKAVKNLPNNVIIRMIRGNVSYAIPEMFGRRKTAFVDYKYLYIFTC